MQTAPRVVFVNKRLLWAQEAAQRDNLDSVANYRLAFWLTMSARWAEAPSYDSPSYALFREGAGVLNADALDWSSREFIRIRVMANAASAGHQLATAEMAIAAQAWYPEDAEVQCASLMVLGVRAPGSDAHRNTTFEVVRGVDPASSDPWVQYLAFVGLSSAVTRASFTPNERRSIIPHARALLSSLENTVLIDAVPLKISRETWLRLLDIADPD